MNISQKGINFIKSFEGLRLTAYKALPSEKYYTIGFGHYGADVGQNETITEAQAENMLVHDLQDYVDGVNNLVKVALNQNQFDALVSFAYNLGVECLAESTLLKYLNEGNYHAAADQIPLFCHAGGQVIQGLLDRRNAERAMFLSSVSQKLTLTSKTSLFAYPNTGALHLGDLAPQTVTFIESLGSWYKINSYVGVAWLKPNYMVEIVEHYTVQSGDNLTLIAKKYGTTVNQLVSWNDLANPDMIQIGQVLRVK